MKKWIKATTATLLAAMVTSCAPTYDSYGNSRQSISPAGAAIGAVAIGALAYSMGNSRGKRHERRRNNNGFHQVQPGWGYGQGGYGNGGHCR